MKRTKKLCVLLLTALLLATAFPQAADSLLNVQTVEAAVKVSKKTAVLIKGQKTTLKISGTAKKIVWSTNKKSVATVSQKGVVTARKKGTAVITAKVGSKKYTCKVTVQTPALNKTSVTVTKGKSTTLKLNGTNQKVTWKSSNTGIATVSKGKVTAKKAGTVKITATVLKKKYTCAVKVSNYNLGHRLNPRSGYTAYTTDVYSYSTHLGKFKVQLLDYKSGSKAYNLIKKNKHNKAPKSGQEYIYVKYKITYLSGRKEVYVNNVISPTLNFFNSKANVKVSNLDWGFDFDNVDSGHSASLYPGGSVICSDAILVRTGNTPVTYRIPTGYDNKNHEATYTWFTTKK